MTPILVTVTEYSIAKEEVDEETLIKYMPICTIYEDPITSTPNKIIITCNYPLEGRYLSLIKLSSTPSILSINEVTPLLHANPVAFASSVVNDLAGNKIYFPSKALDNWSKDDNVGFKSVQERYPWFSIDFGEPRLVQSVLFFVPLSFVASMQEVNKRKRSSIEIRVGYERIGESYKRFVR